MAPRSVATSQSQTKSFIITGAVEVFAQQVQEWKRKRAPAWLKEKLAATRIAERTTTARIFLEHGGFMAWLAYSLATEGAAHFNGRQQRESTVKAFKALSFNDRVAAARQLARVELPIAARRHIKRISIHLEDKGLLAEEGSCHIPEARREATSTENHDFPDNPSSTNSDNTATSASLAGFEDVFGEYMCRAIRKVRCQGDGMKAAVTMQFPDFALHDCVMILEICEEEVESLVKHLFGINMVSVMGIRHLVLEKGVKLTSNTSHPEITLKGVNDKAILNILGPEILEVIIASRMRKTEMEEINNTTTECVSMIFTSRYGEGAYVNVCLDLKGGLRIRDRLYQ